MPSAHSSPKSAFPSCSYWAHCLEQPCNQPSCLSLSLSLTRATVRHLLYQMIYVHHCLKKKNPLSPIKPGTWWGSPHLTHSHQQQKPHPGRQPRRKAWHHSMSLAGSQTWVMNQGWGSNPESHKPGLRSCLPSASPMTLTTSFSSVGLSCLAPSQKLLPETLMSVQQRRMRDMELSGFWSSVLMAKQLPPGLQDTHSWNPVSHHAMQEPKGHGKATCGYSGPQPLWDPSPLHPPDAQGWPQVCPGQPACEHTPLSNEHWEPPSWAQSPPEAGAITVLNECCFIPPRGRVCFTGTDKQNLTLWRSNELRVVKRHIHRRSRVSTPHIWLSTTSQEQVEGGGGRDFAPSSSRSLCSI